MLYAVFAAGGLGELSEVWGEISQASGAAERLFEILAVKPRGEGAGAIPLRCRMPRARRGRVRECALRLSGAAGNAGARRRVVSRVRPGEKVAIVGSLRRRQEHDLPSDPALLRSDLRRASRFDGVRYRATPIRWICAITSRWCRRRPRFSPPRSATISRFGQPDATDAEIERAADMAAATEFIRRLPQGYDDADRRARRHACRAASASASRSRARSCAMRRCCCSMRRRPRSMPKARRWCRRRSSTDGRPHHARDRASACDGAVVRPHPGAGAGQDRGGGHARKPRRRPAASMRGSRSCSFSGGR